MSSIATSLLGWVVGATVVVAERQDPRVVAARRLVMNTLLGPEGTSTALLRWGLDCLLRAFLTLMRNCWAVPGVACGGVLGLVVV